MTEIRLRLSKLRQQYESRYNSKPEYALLNAVEFLTFKNECLELMYQPPTEPPEIEHLIYEGMKILVNPYHMPPKIVINPRDVARFMYLESRGTTSEND